jgi:molecular chaperone GrpE
MPDETQNPEGEGEVPTVVVDDETTRPYKPSDAPPAPSELEQLKQKLAVVENEKKETYERLLRSAADFDNFRKRQRKDLDEARLKAKEDVLKEMLPVIDNLERALAASQDASATSGTVVDGVKLVLRQFTSALDRFEVKPFSALGEPFDPARHEAISQVETTAHPPGTVASEMQRGYTIGPRLLRPALVAVAKAPAAPPAEEPKQEPAD